EIQFFDLAERLDWFDPRFGHVGSGAASEETCLCALFLQLHFHCVLDSFLNQADIAIFRIDVLSAMKVWKAVERTRQGQALVGLFVDGSLAQTFRKVEDVRVVACTFPLL